MSLSSGLQGLSGGLQGLAGSSKRAGVPIPSAIAAATHYWRMQEAAGNSRLDRIGTAHLAESAATVAAGTGLIGNGASFTGAGSKFLTTPSIVDLQFSSSKTIWGWFNPGAADGVGDFIMSKRKTADGGLSEFALAYESSRRLHLIMSDSVIIGSSEVFTANNAVILNQFNFFALWFDATTDASHKTVNLRINNTTVTPVDRGATGLSTNTQALAVGFDVFSVNAVSGIVDEVGVVSSKLSTSDLDWLYNSGAGRQVF